MRNIRGMVIAVMCLPALALAQPTAAPPSTTPAAVVATDEGPVDGLQLQARLPAQLGVSSLISPGFTVGYRMGKLVIGAELGLLAGKLTDNNTTDSFYLVHLMPVVYYDLWESDDGRARLNIVLGIGFGRGKVTSDTTNNMITDTSSETASYIPILAGLGGDYYLHKNFALGVEVGAELPLLTGVDNNGIDQSVSGGVQSVRGLIRLTFVAGR